MSAESTEGGLFRETKEEIKESVLNGALPGGSIKILGSK